MPPRRPRLDPEERALRAITRMSAGTALGRVESASPSRQRTDPRVSQIGASTNCPCPIPHRLCTPGGAGELGPRILALDPVFYWPLEETTGTTTADESGNGWDGDHGPDSVGLDTVAGITGCGNAFDFTDTNINVDSVTGFSEFSFTACAWIKADATDSRGIIRHDAGNDVTGIIILYLDADGVVTAVIYDGSNHTLVGTTTITPGDVYFVAVAGTAGGTARLYVFKDGVGGEEASAAIGSPSWTSGRWRVGDGNSWTGRFNGIIDDVAVFNYELTEEQLADLALGCGEDDTCALEVTDGILFLDGVHGDASIALPPAATAQPRLYFVKRVDDAATVLTLNPYGSETIDLAGSLALGPLDGAQLYPAFDAWWVM